MAGAGAGQDIALGLLVILARDLEVYNGIEKKRDDQTIGDVVLKGIVE